MWRVGVGPSFQEQVCNPHQLGSGVSCGVAFHQQPCFLLSQIGVRAQRILSTRGAYVLFPGDGVGGRVAEPTPNLFVRHPSAFGGGSVHRIPSVGAFDLSPGGGPAQVAAIQALIGAALEAAAAGAPYQEEQANFASK